jgi:hypothetical protein
MDREPIGTGRLPALGGAKGPFPPKSVEEEVANSMKPDELIAIRRKLRMERWELGEAVGYTGAAWCYVPYYMAK